MTVEEGRSLWSLPPTQGAAPAVPEKLSQMLYAARWLGTLLVLAVHSAAIFLNFNILPPGGHSFFAEAWRFLVSFEFAHEAVIGFFVMSGFLVGGAAMARLGQAKPFLLDYCVHRVARIYLVLLPAIGLTFLFDSLGRSLSVDPGAYVAFDGHYDPLLMLGDLANLQGVIVKHYGTNGPLWSVGYEFWFYIFFPLLLLPFGRAYSPKAGKILAALALVACVAVSIRQIWFLFGFVIWGLGAALTLAPRPLLRSAWASLVIVLAANVAMRTIFPEAILREIPATQYLSDAIVALAFANLILSMRFAAPLDWRFLDWSLHKRLADFSFTLYAIHNPTIMLLRAVALMTLGRDAFDGAATEVQWLVLAGSMSLTILLAYALSRVTEARLGPARRVLAAFVGGLAARASTRLSARAPVDPKADPETEAAGLMRTRPWALRSGA